METTLQNLLTQISAITKKDDVKKELLEKLIHDLHNICKDHCDLKKDGDLLIKWGGFYFEPEGWKHYAIGFSFDKDWANNCFYGIRKKNMEDTNIPVHITKIMDDKLRNMMDDINEKWPRARYFEPFDWWYNNELWIEIAKGEMARKIWGKVKEILSEFENEKL